MESNDQSRSVLLVVFSTSLILSIAIGGGIAISYFTFFSVNTIALLITGVLTLILYILQTRDTYRDNKAMQEAEEKKDVSQPQDNQATELENKNNKTTKYEESTLNVISAGLYGGMASIFILFILDYLI